MLLLLLIASLSCFVRAEDIPVRIQEPALQRENLSEAERAAQEIKKREDGGAKPDVTYEQILERPDDIDLNYRYALTQIHQDNLRSAAATLERILMVNSNLPKVRLLYAVVLFRLDNLDDSARELEALRLQPMPDSLRAEMNDYLRQIAKRRHGTHYDILLGAGLDYNDNRNAAPASGQRLFFDTPITLDASSTRKSDVAKTMLASLGVKHELSSQAGHQLFADYSYYRAEQTNQRILNLQNHAADLGLLHRGRWAETTATGEFDHLLLTQTTYLRSRGARLHFERKNTPTFAPFLETAYTRQEYNRTLAVPTGNDRSGDKIEGSAGANWALTPTMNLFGSYTYVDQGAAAKFDAYRRHSFLVSHTWLVGHGQFLLSAATIDLDQYEQAELAVSATNRRDTTYRGRITYGIPLSFAAKSLQNLVWTWTYEYYHALSNLPNYSYTNNKISTLLTYKWEL